MPLRSEPARLLCEEVLDSFDRRLQRSGISLSVSTDSVLALCHLVSDATSRNGHRLEHAPGEIVLEQRPVFAWDFPAPHANRLAHCLEARALDVLAEHETSVQRLAVLDDQEKVVARIEEELHSVRPARRASGRERRVRRVVLRGVLGYDAEFERVRQALEASPALHGVPDEPFDPRRLLAPPARRPGRWPLLAPRISALDGLARIVRSQLAVLKANEAGLRANRDAEYLHDTRVAMRRLRSLIGQLHGVVVDEEREHLAVELRWIASCTGRPRDLDTLLGELRLTELELRAKLTPVLTALEAERARAQETLLEALDSKRRADLLARLRAAFGTGRDERLAGKQAARPFAQVLGKRLRRRWRQVGARASGLDATRSAGEFHELRIACKKLRYLLECSRGLVSKSQAGGCFARLRGLQDVLGTIQDAEVHAGLVDELAGARARDAGPESLLALGRFRERISQRGQAARARCRELLDELLGPASRAEFDALLRALAKGEHHGR
jgi:CHAD domain-containing protein